MTTATKEPKILTLTPKRHAHTVKVRADAASADTLRFIITTERQASDGGILLADGMDASEFTPRPFVLLRHNPDEIFGRCIELKRVDEGWEGVVQKLSDEACSEPVKRWWAILRDCGFGAASIGFRCTDVDWEPKAEEVVKYGGNGRAWIGRKWTLLEWSIVSVPADSGATMTKMSAGDISFPGMDGEERRALIRSFALSHSQSLAKRLDATAGTEDTGAGDGSTDGTEGDAGDAADAETDTEMIAKLDEVVAAIAAIAEGQKAIVSKLDQLVSADATEADGATQKSEEDGAAHADAILAEIEKEMKAAAQAVAK